MEVSLNTGGCSNVGITYTIYSAVLRKKSIGKWKPGHSPLIFFTVCSACKGKFVVGLFVTKKQLLFKLFIGFSVSYNTICIKRNGY
jgi:hypothetical protein